MHHRYIDLRFHFIWSTWDRVGWVQASIRPRVHGAIASLARRERCTYVTVGGTEDHVHVLHRAPPTLAVSTLVGRLKGGSSHFAHERLGVHQDARWSKGFAAFSLSELDEPALRQYVLNQELHHKSGTSDPTHELPYPIIVDPKRG